MSSRDSSSSPSAPLTSASCECSTEPSPLNGVWSPSASKQPYHWGQCRGCPVWRPRSRQVGTASHALCCCMSLSAPPVTGDDSLAAMTCTDPITIMRIHTNYNFNAPGKQFSLTFLCPDKKGPNSRSRDPTQSLQKEGDLEYASSNFGDSDAGTGERSKVMILKAESLRVRSCLFVYLILRYWVPYVTILFPVPHLLRPTFLLCVADEDALDGHVWKSAASLQRRGCTIEAVCSSLLYIFRL
jgi:hypothetical protein